MELAGLSPGPTRCLLHSAPSSSQIGGIVTEAGCDLTGAVRRNLSCVALVTRCWRQPPSPGSVDRGGGQLPLRKDKEKRLVEVGWPLPGPAG